MVDHVFGGQQRGGQVVGSLPDEHFHVRILGHRTTQGFAGGRQCALLPFPFFIHLETQRFIRQIGLDSQLGTDVVIECSRIGRCNGDHGGIEFRAFGHCQRLHAFEARIQPSHAALVAAQEFLAEVEDVDAQIGTQHVIQLQSRVGSQLPGHGMPFVLAQSIALHQRDR